MSKNEESAPVKAAKALPSLNVLNTAMAADRTLMAWIRTALSMFTFGFTLFKVLQAIQAAGNSLPSENTPRNAGVTLVAIGVVAVVMGMIEFLHTRQQISLVESVKLPRSPTAVMAVLTAGVGIFLLIVIFRRLL